MVHVHDQVKRWLGKRGPAVHKLNLFIHTGDLRQTWPQDATGLLSLVPNLQSLEMYDRGEFFAAAEDMKFIGQLTGLQHLQLSLGLHELSFSQPATSEPLRHLASLESLSLHLGTYERGTAIRLSQHLADLSRLTHLAVSGCGPHNLRELIPQLTSLRSLSIGSRLEMLPSSFGSLCLLQSLSLGSFDRYGPAFSIPEALSSCQALARISLVELSRATVWEWSSLCKSFLCLPALRVLHIIEADLSCVRDDAWVLHPQLQDLSLAYCCLQFCPAALCSLSSLTSLELQSNGLEHLPAGPYLEHLQELDISGNEDLADLSCLAAATSLQTLILGKLTQVDSSEVAAVLPSTCYIDLLE